MNDMLKNSVAEYRQKSEMTQESLADAVGVTRQTIIAIEKGNYAPSVLLALKIADFFDKPLEKIFYVER
jgi:putative transcriptional regulator